MPMAQATYKDRLPYGYSFDKENRVESIFDRGYRILATRSVDEPWKAVYCEKPLPKGPSGESFFVCKERAISPRRAAIENLQTRERVLCKFMLGLDVRALIKSGNRYRRVRGAKFLAENNPRRFFALRGKDFE